MGKEGKQGVMIAEEKAFVEAGLTVPGFEYTCEYPVEQGNQHIRFVLPVNMRQPPEFTFGAAYSQEIITYSSCVAIVSCPQHRNAVVKNKRLHMFAVASFLSSDNIAAGQL